MNGKKLYPKQKSVCKENEEKTDFNKNDLNYRKAKYTPYQNIRLEVVREPAYRMIKISSPVEVFNELKEEAKKLDREYFWVICLNSQNMVIGINTVSIGSANSTVVEPREVFKPAILVNSISVILAHNHPSGTPQPSSEDKKITGRLKEAGELLNIKVLDHVIIGDESFYSFMENNSI